MPLSAKQREHLEGRLKEERAFALRLVNHDARNPSEDSEQDRAGDLSKMPSHAADLGTTTMDEELDASNTTRVSRELAEIDAALERLYKHPDQFGKCEETGEDISFERLDIIPWARTINQKGPGVRS